MSRWGRLSPQTSPEVQLLGVPNTYSPGIWRTWMFGVVLIIIDIFLSNNNSVERIHSLHSWNHLRKAMLWMLQPSPFETWCGPIVPEIYKSFTPRIQVLYICLHLPYIWGTWGVVCQVLVSLLPPKITSPLKIQVPCLQKRIFNMYNS